MYLTVWEVDGVRKKVETLLDTGCNITAIELNLIKSINTRSKRPVQIGPLTHPINLQTAAMNTIAACGKVEVNFRFGETPMRHNSLVFPKLPYRVVLGT